MSNVSYGKDHKGQLDYNRWIDLEKLPMCGKKVDWKNSINVELKFQYQEINGTLKIVDYQKKKSKLIIEFNNDTFEIFNGHLVECKLGRIVGKITKEFKISIGDILKDNKRDITIIDRMYKKSNSNKILKYYKYECNKCNFGSSEHYKNGKLVDEYWIDEVSLLKGHGCACCCNSPQITVSHINSIVAKEETHWMIPYFQGGYEEAKKYTPSSNQKVYFKCPDCGEIIKTRNSISSLYTTMSIGCKKCSDGISYPEKFMYSVLGQLGLTFETQLNKNILDWCDKYRYDFYIPEFKCIIETHGGQHYEGSTGLFSTSLKEQQNIDSLKKELALSNGIEHYIELDCRKSNSEWIKNSILNSELSNLFDLSKINWNTVSKESNRNLLKTVCDYWELCDKNNTTTLDLKAVFNVSKDTIINYLKVGANVGFCTYDTYEEMKKCAIRNGKKCSKIVDVLKDGMVVATFESISELERQSIIKFGTKLNTSAISNVISGKRKHHKGFTFKYVETNKEEIA